MHKHISLLDLQVWKKNSAVINTGDFLQIFHRFNIGMKKGYTILKYLNVDNNTKLVESSWNQFIRRTQAHINYRLLLGVFML